MSERIHFPQGFLWGSATSSYQVEGGANEGGRGRSIWDDFSHAPGNTRDGDTGDVADDHYHLWKQDVDLMKSLGLQAYRFSIAWPRILPEGVGKVNEDGLAFYDRLVDELLKNGIQPLITLYHWDLPSALPGGWLNRSTALAFAEYADIVSRCLGDRVKLWTTTNEPFCAAFLGYAWGWHAPGVKDYSSALRAAHHLHLAHGLGVQTIRANVKGAAVGQVANPTLVQAFSSSPEDQYALRFYDGLANRWFLDPIFGRGYPEDMLADFQRLGYLPESPDFIQPGDMETIAAPTDMLGINYYSRTVVKATEGHGMEPGAVDHVRDENVERTDIGWEIYPSGIYELLAHINETYHPASLFIAENGAAFSDGPDSSGQVHDERRVSYMRRHLVQLARAVNAGIPITGYFAWSLLDNFEWAHGYSQRFGIVHVDYATQKRAVKDSALFYKDVIEQNAVGE